MTDHNREALIEEAAKAIHDAHMPTTGVTPPWEREQEAWRETYRDFARAALAVFEQAHPVQGRENSAQNSDDEREAPIRVVAEAFEKHEGAPSWQDDPVGRDAALRWHMRGFEDGLNAQEKN